MKGKNVKKVLSAVLAGTMLLSLAACGNGNEGNAGSSGEKTKSEDQVLSIALGEEPTILDPYQIQDDNAFNVSYAVTEPLFRIAGEDGKDWEPGLATEFEENEDATVYTVTLRENAKWSDGTPITAEDVVYSFQRVVDPSFASPKANDYFYLKNAEAIIKGEKDKQELGVKALDDYTVEFVLEKPVDFFVDCLKTPGWAPIQKEAGEKYQDLYGAEPENMVFSGPFVVSEWVHDNSITLKKNDNYWDAKNVTLEEIQISLTSDKNAIQGMYEAGDLDMQRIGTELFEKYKDSPELREEGRLSVSFIEFNPKVEFLNNIKIREALSIAFDRKAYAANVVKNEKLAAYGMVPYGIRGTENGDFREQQGDLVKDAATDPKAIDRAKALLDEGLKEIGKSKKEMEDFLEILCVDSEGSKLQAQAVQAMWKDNLDLELTVTPMQTKMLIPMLTEGTFHCVIGGANTASYPDASEFLSFIYDEGKMDDPQFTEMWETSLSQIGDERIQTLKEVETYVLDQYVYIPQNFVENNYVISEKVEGLNIWPFGSEYDFKNVVMYE